MINADTYRVTRQLAVGANTGRLLRDLLPAGRFRVSAAMPDTANTIATYLLYPAANPTRGMICPTWAGVQLVNDIYTRAKQGERILTAIMIAGFQLADTTPWLSWDTPPSGAWVLPGHRICRPGRLPGGRHQRADPRRPGPGQGRGTPPRTRRSSAGA